MTNTLEDWPQALSLASAKPGTTPHAWDGRIPWQVSNLPRINDVRPFGEHELRRKAFDTRSAARFFNRAANNFPRCKMRLVSEDQLIKLLGDAPKRCHGDPIETIRLRFRENPQLAAQCVRKRV